jgi:exopolysaccharide biosynthesis polyprenyl glycosylphosphotransferase
MLCRPKGDADVTSERTFLSGSGDERDVTAISRVRSALGNFQPEPVQRGEHQASLAHSARWHKQMELERTAELAAEAVASGLDEDDVLGAAGVRPLHQLRPVPPLRHSLTDRHRLNHKVGSLVHDPFSARRRRAPEWLVRYTVGLVAGDLAAVAVASAVAVLFLGTPIPVIVGIAVAAVALWPVVIAAVGGYAERRLGTGSDEYRRVLVSGLIEVSLLGVVSAVSAAGSVRSLILFGAPLATALTLLSRAFLRRRLHAARRADQMTKRVVAVGREASVADLVRRLRRDPTAGFTVVGACVPQPWRATALTDLGVSVLGGMDDAVDALERTHADAVLVASASDGAGQYLRNLSWRLEGTNIEVLVAPGLIEVAPARMQIRPTTSLPLIHVREPEFRGMRRVVKGLFDRSLAALLLVLGLPVFVLLALAVRCSSAGPVFYRHRRVGMRGREFDLLKFRSMVVDADRLIDDLMGLNEGNDVQFKMRSDPRVTAVGRFLRRSSLDELPQLLNVLRGEMSIVGPRPHVTREVDQYGPDMHRRLLVKPGITGLWQVSGRSNLTWDESVEIDVRYVENWSLSLDLMIIWRTGRAVIKASGAY